MSRTDVSSVPWTVPGHIFMCATCAQGDLCVICECVYVPNTRFILMQWNVVFCMSFVVGVVQCAFDARLRAHNHCMVCKCFEVSVLMCEIVIRQRYD